MLTTEPNYQRKSHRVNLPLVVQVNGKTYRSNDWSLTGLSLVDFETDLKPEEIIKATLIFPMKESRLDLDIEMEFRSVRGNLAGFEFKSLSQRNRRIMRHYIELAVEGKLDNVEDLISIVTAPEINSPIHEALVLSDLEEESLIQRFRFRSFLSISVGILFILFVLATLFYNTSYRISGTGIISGNLRKISSGVNGTVSSTHIKTGQRITQKTALVSVYDEQFDQQLNALEKRRKQLLAEIDQVQSSNQATVSSYFQHLQKIFIQRTDELNRAKQLFEQRQITVKDLRYIENQYNQAALNLSREQDGLSQSLSNNKLSTLQESLAELQERIQTVQAKGSIRTVQSPIAGQIFNLPVESGLRVTAGETIAVIQEDKAPYVLIRLLNADAIKLTPGMKANIVVPFLEREYPGFVSAIGYSAVNSEVNASQEASLNETLIKLTFEDTDIRIPANTRVKVWVRTFEWPWSV